MEGIKGFLPLKEGKGGKGQGRASGRVRDGTGSPGQRFGSGSGRVTDQSPDRLTRYFDPDSRLTQSVTIVRTWFRLDYSSSGVAFLNGHYSPLKPHPALGLRGDRRPCVMLLVQVTKQH